MERSQKLEMVEMTDALKALSGAQRITVRMHDELTGHPLPILIITPVPLDGLSRERLLLSVGQLVRERYGHGTILDLLTDEEGEDEPVFVASYAGQVLAQGRMEVEVG